MKADIIIRQANEEDHPFILNSWLISYYAGSHLDKVVESQLYFTNQTEIIERILENHKPNIHVACLPEFPKQILGWLCSDGYLNAIHYVYVKHPYRRFGIANLLFREASRVPTALWFTHFTRQSDIIGPKWGLKYNPYILMGIF